MDEEKRLNEKKKKTKLKQFLKLHKENFLTEVNYNFFYFI